MLIDSIYTLFSAKTALANTIPFVQLFVLAKAALNTQQLSRAPRLKIDLKIDEQETCR